MSPSFKSLGSKSVTTGQSSKSFSHVSEKDIQERINYCEENLINRSWISSSALPPIFVKILHLIEKAQKEATQNTIDSGSSEDELKEIVQQLMETADSFSLKDLSVQSEILKRKGEAYVNQCQVVIREALFTIFAFYEFQTDIDVDRKAHMVVNTFTPRPITSTHFVNAANATHYLEKAVQKNQQEGLRRSPILSLKDVLAEQNDNPSELPLGGKETLSAFFRIFSLETLGCLLFGVSWAESSVCKVSGIESLFDQKPDVGQQGPTVGQQELCFFNFVAQSTLWFASFSLMIGVGADKSLVYKPQLQKKVLRLIYDRLPENEKKNLGQTLSSEAKEKLRQLGFVFPQTKNDLGRLSNEGISPQNVPNTLTQTKIWTVWDTISFEKKITNDPWYHFILKFFSRRQENKMVYEVIADDIKTQIDRLDEENKKKFRSCVTGNVFKMSFLSRKQYGTFMDHFYSRLDRNGKDKLIESLTATDHAFLGERRTNQLEDTLRKKREGIDNKDVSETHSVASEASTNAESEASTNAEDKTSSELDSPVQNNGGECSDPSSQKTLADAVNYVRLVMRTGPWKDRVQGTKIFSQLRFDILTCADDLLSVEDKIFLLDLIRNSLATGFHGFFAEGKKPRMTVLGSAVMTWVYVVGAFAALVSSVYLYKFKLVAHLITAVFGIFGASTFGLFQYRSFFGSSAGHLSKITQIETDLSYLLEKRSAAQLHRSNDDICRVNQAPHISDLENILKRTPNEFTLQQNYNHFLLFCVYLEKNKTTNLEQRKEILKAIQEHYLPYFKKLELHEFVFESPYANQGDSWLFFPDKSTPLFSILDAWQHLPKNESIYSSSPNNPTQIDEIQKFLFGLYGDKLPKIETSDDFQRFLAKGLHEAKKAGMESRNLSYLHSIKVLVLLHTMKPLPNQESSPLYSQCMKILGQQLEFAKKNRDALLVELNKRPPEDAAAMRSTWRMISNLMASAMFGFGGFFWYFLLFGQPAGALIASSSFHMRILLALGNLAGGAAIAGVDMALRKVGEASDLAGNEFEVFFELAACLGVRFILDGVGNAIKTVQRMFGWKETRSVFPYYKHYTMISQFFHDMKNQVTEKESQNDSVSDSPKGAFQQLIKSLESLQSDPAQGDLNVLNNAFTKAQLENNQKIITKLNLHLSNLSDPKQRFEVCQKQIDDILCMGLDKESSLVCLARAFHLILNIQLVSREGVPSEECSKELFQLKLKLVRFIRLKHLVREEGKIGGIFHTRSTFGAGSGYLLPDFIMGFLSGSPENAFFPLLYPHQTKYPGGGFFDFFNNNDSIAGLQHAEGAVRVLFDVLLGTVAYIGWAHGWDVQLQGETQESQLALKSFQLIDGFLDSQLNPAEEAENSSVNDSVENSPTTTSWLTWFCNFLFLGNRDDHPPIALAQPYLKNECGA